MKKYVIMVGLLLVTVAHASELKKSEICFNDKDAASTGMTAEEYYKAIKSTCEKQMELALKKESENKARAIAAASESKAVQTTDPK